MLRALVLFIFGLNKIFVPTKLSNLAFIPSKKFLQYLVLKRCFVTTFGHCFK